MICANASADTKCMTPMKIMRVVSTQRSGVFQDSMIGCYGARLQWEGSKGSMRGREHRGCIDTAEAGDRISRVARPATWHKPFFSLGCAKRGYGPPRRGTVLPSGAK